MRKQNIFSLFGYMQTIVSFSLPFIEKMISNIYSIQIQIAKQKTHLEYESY